MDVDKLKKWLDVAQQFQGENFWADIFDSSKQGNPQHQPNPHQNGINQAMNHGSGQSGKGPVQEGASPYDSNQTPASPQPAVDIFETDTEWIIVMDLPGVKKNDIQLNLVGHRLIVKGVAHLSHPDTTIIHSERLNGTFERSINMPENLSLNNLPAAKFFDGLLEVRLPRERPKKHQIKID